MVCWLKHELHNVLYPNPREAGTTCSCPDSAAPDVQLAPGFRQAVAGCRTARSHHLHHPAASPGSQAGPVVSCTCATYETGAESLCHDSTARDAR